MHLPVLYSTSLIIWSWQILYRAYILICLDGMIKQKFKQGVGEALGFFA